MIRIRAFVLPALTILAVVPVGCAPEAHVAENVALIAELEAELIEKEALVAGLEQSLADWETRESAHDSAGATISATPPQSATSDAMIVALYEPGPIPCRQGSWSWRMTLKEISGVAVELSDITVELHGDGGLLKAWSDQSLLRAVGQSIPAGGARECSVRTGYLEGVTQVVLVLSGIDEYGHPVIAERQMRLLPPAPGEAKIEITFDPDPVPCRAGRWIWTLKYTEVNGVGITLDGWTRTSCRNDGHCGTTVYDAAYWTSSSLSGCYLPANRWVSWTNNLNCQDVAYVAYTVTGTDDNGNVVTATAVLEFLR